MAQKDLYSNVDQVQSVTIAAKVTGGSPYNGTGVDLAGYEGALAIVQVGTKTDGTHVIKLQDSPDNSTWTDCVAADQQGTFPANVTSDTPIRVGYIGTQRYLRAVCTSSGTTTGAVLGVAIVRGFPRSAPLA